MKKVIFLLVVLAATTSAFAKKKPKLLFEHVGRMTYHAAKSHYILEGQTDIFEDGEYVCLPGDEHHAPNCGTRAEWTATDAFAYVEIKLDDDSTVVVTDNSEDSRYEPWKHDGDTVTLRTPGNDGKSPLFSLVQDWEVHHSVADGSQTRFSYAIDQFGNIYVNQLAWLNANPWMRN